MSIYFGRGGQSYCGAVRGLLSKLSSLLLATVFTLCLSAQSDALIVNQNSSTIVNPTPAASEQCATSAAIGDVNGDTYGDVALGCTGTSSFAGSVVVYIQDGTDHSFGSTAELDNPTPASNDACGASVAIGDVNGDGRDDVIMGCNGDDTYAGKVVVFTRNSGNSGFDAGVELTDATTPDNDYCGDSVAVGDVNGDGRDDIVAGCTGNDTGASSAGKMILFIRNSGNSGFESAVSLTDPTPGSSDLCGYKVATGDVNGDGKDDLLMGCYGYSSYRGKVALFTRNVGNSGFDTGVELTDPTPANNSYCGISLTTGDANGDGKDDVITGCSFDGTGATNAGNILVIFRNEANDGFETGAEISNPTPVTNDQCGSAVAAGDVNSDGLDDVMAGCRYDDTGASNAGNTVLFIRNSGNDGFDSVLELADPSPVADANCGASLAAGEIISSGITDMVTGCPLDDEGATNAGGTVLMTIDRLPSVSITSPSTGAEVSGSVAVTASASDDGYIGTFQFKLDGANLGSADTSHASTYETDLDTTTLDDGTHTLSAVVVDSSDQTTTSSEVTITVDNTSDSDPTTDPPTPTTDPTPSTVALASTIDTLKKSYRKDLLKKLTGTATGTGLTGVKVALVRTGKNCSWLTKNNKFKTAKKKKSSKTTSCKPATKNFVKEAKLVSKGDGSYSWSLSLPKALRKNLKPGKYKVYVRAVSTTDAESPQSANFRVKNSSAVKKSAALFMAPLLTTLFS